MQNGVEQGSLSPVSLPLQKTNCGMTSTKHWTTDPDGEVNVKVTLAGPAAIAPTTVVNVFKRAIQTFPRQTAFSIKRNGEWKQWTYMDYYRDVCAVAKSLFKLGLDPKHSVCIIGFNSPEWFISYVAAIMAGGVATGIYSTNNADSCHFIAEDSRCQVFIAEDKMQLDKILKVKDRLPNLKAIVQYLPGEVDEEQKAQGVMSWQEFREYGNDVPEYEISWRMNEQKPGHCASLIYTSGTTGPPKGVMLSHDNLTWTAAVVSHAYKLTLNDRFISYLPLSHVAAQMMDIHAPLHAGFTVWFAPPDAMRSNSFLITLREVKPTVFFGVPRVWEKFREKVEENLLEAKGWKEVVLEKSRSLGRKACQNRLSGNEAPWGYWFANQLVFKNLRDKMGLENCRLCASGAAPLPKSVLDFFEEFDIPIYVLYGMSESTGPQTFNLEGKNKPGSAGTLMPGAEMKVINTGPNGDGEICYRGRHVFMGYLRQEEKTRAAIDDEGWLHSGDIGRTCDQGFLYITGRIKELLITRGGENIAPVPIEQRMLNEMKLLSRCMVVGDEQRYLTMLVTLKCEMTPDQVPKDELTPIALSVMRQIKSDATTVSEAIADPAVSAYIEQGIKKVNELSISRAARVQKFSILPVDLSIPGGEMTPTMKMKRKVILEKYHHLVTAMYAE